MTFVIYGSNETLLNADTTFATFRYRYLIAATGLVMFRRMLDLLADFPLCCLWPPRIF